MKKQSQTGPHKHPQRTHHRLQQQQNGHQQHHGQCSERLTEPDGVPTVVDGVGAVPPVDGVQQPCEQRRRWDGEGDGGEEEADGGGGGGH